MSTSRRDELPLAGYDDLPVGDLEHRIRALDAGQLKELLGYEREHAARRPVEELLTARLGQLEDGGSPSPGGSEPGGVQGAGSRAGSPVTPATSPEPIHPPPHGTPDQRGKPKGNRP
ncbi:hypothetical protein V1J52_18315 [Streptomyces sp. TRM 70351]|uniref:hypothetical protein n=1 Tax=Streptomyces sp. TRM 70351 TaxID=3116552 RepID=UPI002E7C06DB|nr:hypothetical protein [Streptomyces sp. TRM 70351]MEE1930115.1 hypothetical protein [Streptomyces sp. TRM 70351]